MIPKIIHYTWFSDEPFLSQIKDCIDSWHRHMPDWEFRLWDATAVEKIDSVWLKEALSAHKWAFAADFVRLYAVYHFGGIYLDADVMVYQSFEPLLDNTAFIGRESSIHFNENKSEVYLTSHCFGAEKDDEFIKCCLDYYNNRHFRLSDLDWLPDNLKYDLKLLPFIQCELARTIGYRSNVKSNYQQNCKNWTIYPSSYFDATYKDVQSYCKHLALGAWREKKPKSEKITLSYKIEWRIVSVFKKILRIFDYTIIKLK